MAWVLPLNPDATNVSMANAPAHTKILDPLRVVQNYCQLLVHCATKVKQAVTGDGLQGTSDSVGCVLVPTPWLSGRRC
jgi:hypothetical protein